MKFIWYLLHKEFISPAFARWLELFVLSTLLNLAVGILDNIDVIINWGEVDWKLFLTTFGTTTALSVTAAIKKHLRDKKYDAMLEDLDID